MDSAAAAMLTIMVLLRSNQQLPAFHDALASCRITIERLLLRPCKYSKPALNMR
jgi:hypothetical protein